MSVVTTITTELEHPICDDRRYRVIVLPNGLEAVLVQDETVDKAAAALSVNVGSFSDSKDFYGLAHFCEHLLFMGTEKYPSENEYRQYLTEHSGHSNAYTASDETNYHFEVAHEHLEGALDRFAQFFISPLFLADCKDRELRAVDSENKKNLQSDNWRLHQLDKFLSNPAHPFSNFSTGNLVTLEEEPKQRGQDVRDVLLEFYNQQYSSNIMKLSIIGRENLDTLEKWVTDRFSLITNNHASPPQYDAAPLLKEHLGFLIKAKPVKNSKYIIVSFPIPDQRELHDSKPSHYFSHLIGHEGKGSLLQYYKNHELATALSAGTQHISKGHDLFVIDIKLSDKGLLNYEEVLSGLFQYLNMVTSLGPQKWVFNELQKIAETGFKFQDKISAYRTSIRLATTLQKLDFPREQLLSLELMREYRPDLISQLAKYLNPNNFRAMLLASELEGLDKREKWYGTEYGVVDFTPEYLTSLNKPSQNSELHLPPPNQFIPANFNVDKHTVETSLKHPSIIERTDSTLVWHKKDDTFWMPKSRICLNFSNPTVNSSPRNAIRSVMFVELLNESLIEIAYDAEVAGLKYAVSLVRSGIEVIVSGFNDKIAVLLESILLRIKNYEVDPSMFRILKESQLQNYHNIGFAPPYMQSTRYPFLLLAENHWHPELKEQELQELEAEDVQAFIPELLGKFQTEILAVGNITRAQTLEISSLTQSILKNEPLHEAQRILNRAYILPEGQDFYHEVVSKDPKNVNSCIDYYVQVCEATDVKLRTTLDLVAQISHEPAFTRLRTQEQLGYIVFSGARTVLTMSGYRVLVQSEKPSEYLEGRIDSFLEYFGEILDDMTTEELQTQITALKAKYLEKNKNLGEEASRYWGRMQSGYYDFLRHERQASILDSITKDDVLELYRIYIDPRSNIRSKLVVHLKAQGAAQESVESVMTGSIMKLVVEQGLEYAPEEMQETMIACQGKDLHGVLEVVQTGLVKKGMKPSEAARFIQLVAADVQLTLKSAAETDAKYPEGATITSYSAFKSQLTLSRAPTPIFDLSVYEDSESKL